MHQQSFQGTLVGIAEWGSRAATLPKMANLGASLRRHAEEALHLPMAVHPVRG